MRQRIDDPQRTLGAAQHRHGRNIFAHRAAVVGRTGQQRREHRDGLAEAFGAPRNRLRSTGDCRAAGRRCCRWAGLRRPARCRPRARRPGCRGRRGIASPGWCGWCRAGWRPSAARGSRQAMPRWRPTSVASVAPAALGGFGDEAAQRAGVRHHRHAVTARQGEAGEELDRLDRVLERIEADHAGAAGDGVERLGAAGERAGMRQRRGARGLGCADLHRHDGLAVGAGAPRRFEEVHRRRARLRCSRG